ncbi:hypothetical protein MRX96_027815 [Rhipicephalus microplus]
MRRARYDCLCGVERRQVWRRAEEERKNLRALEGRSREREKERAVDETKLFLLAEKVRRGGTQAKGRGAGTPKIRGRLTVGLKPVLLRAPQKSSRERARSCIFIRTLG